MMRFDRSFLVASLCALPVVFAAVSVSAAKDSPLAPASKAVTEEVLDAVGAELERAMTKMRIPGAPVPYFIGYKLTEVDVNDVVASLGALIDEGNRNSAVLEAHVHVGSYELDNSNFVVPRRTNLDGSSSVLLALEGVPSLARRSAWRVTDAAYKEAIDQWQAKGESRASGASGDRNKVASYAASPPVVTESPAKVSELASIDALATRAKAISEAFRKYSYIRDSRVAYTSFLENRWYLNSEGTSSVDTRRVEGVLVVATAQAQDGQELTAYFSRYGASNADLPSVSELETKVENMAELLNQMTSAPLAENYTGPILFEGEGAVGMVRHTLANHITGTPPPGGISSTSAQLSGKLVGRKSQKVVSDLLSIVDDPTATRANDTRGKRAVIGGYRFDDEGVASKRISVVKNGRLNELPMSRTPNAEQASSNGHARLLLPGGVYRGSVTNLQVSGKKGASAAQLRKKLLAEAKRQGLPYAIVIRQLDDVAITSNSELSSLALLQILQSMNSQAPPQATVAYRVYANGDEELVRGVQLEPVPMRAWRDVIAVGKGFFLKNYLASTEGAFETRLRGVGAGRVPSAGIESSVTTPDLLFRELDVRATKFGLRPPAPIPPP